MEVEFPVIPDVVHARVTVPVDVKILNDTKPVESFIVTKVKPPFAKATMFGIVPALVAVYVVSLVTARVTPPAFVYIA